MSRGDLPDCENRGVISAPLCGTMGRMPSFRIEHQTCITRKSRMIVRRSKHRFCLFNGPGVSR